MVTETTVFVKKNLLVTVPRGGTKFCNTGPYGEVPGSVIDEVERSRSEDLACIGIL